MVDVLASGADEGRGRLRYASGSCQPSCDPRVSEWGNPAPVMGCYRMLNEIGVRGERGEVKHLSTRRKRKQIVIPWVVASESGWWLNLHRVIPGRGCGVGVVGCR